MSPASKFVNAKKGGKLRAGCVHRLFREGRARLVDDHESSVATTLVRLTMARVTFCASSTYPEPPRSEDSARNRFWSI